MDLREIGWDGADWIDMAEDRDQWRALGFHKMLGGFLRGCTIDSSSRRAQLRK
jgi:hypothetical protein